ncbi:unnamed protein product [Cylindrotheca closterium]|uniref:Histidine kinase n=1 Tax=Cylindrotheca closterium TaxID=2856 RepID=A0AAD2G7W5_9STRA|nr:unnamed protein product [Cylindrotheca closterium]
MDAELSTAILAAVIDPTIVIGEDGIIVYFNPAACQAFQMDADSVVENKLNVSSLMANESEAHQHDQFMLNYKETGMKKMIGRNRRVLAKRSDNTTFYASLSISEVTLGGDIFFVGTLRDVTETMEREELFRNVIDEAVDAIFTINEKGIITLVNKSAQKMFHYKEHELIGNNISMLMPQPHRAMHDQYLEAHFKTGIQKMIGTDRTVTAQRKDGTEFKCRLGLSKIETAGTSGASEQGGTTFVGLLHDLTLELAVREADARAELADRMRKQKALFLASMSHEIRTPLNGIFGMLELLQSTQLDSVQTEWLATCSRSAQSLTTILDDILLFSRADGGGISLERLSFNIRDTIEDAVTVMAPKTNDNAIDLVYTVARSVPDFVIGDPTRLRQIFLILLSNALKFTQVGHVALEVSVEGVEDDSDDDSETDDEDFLDKSKKTVDDNKVVLKFEVSDTGIGISKKHIKKLFQPFTQADDSTTRQYGGTGLGLSIAQKLVSLMDGDIKVESRPGRGSTFSFTSVLEKDPDGSSSSDLHDNVSEEDLKLLKNVHILSIDDNAVNTAYLVNLLKIIGCDVKGARSGTNGIELLKLAALREDPYEIVLLDFAMPHMSGLEVAEFIASSQSIANTNVRIIMLGSIDVHRSIAACPHVHGFTTKPIRRFPLIKMIVEQLKIKRGMLSLTNTARLDLAKEDGHNDESEDEIPGPVQSLERRASVGFSNNGQRPNPLSILLVEDNLINQKVIVSILTRWKCQVTTALNGLSGFEERISHRGKRAFDLCLMDLHMPLCDGSQCVKMIREWEEENNQDALKIVAVTADADKDTEEACLSGGFDEFLPKPLRKNALRDMVVKVCGEDRLSTEVQKPLRSAASGGPTPRSPSPPAGASHVLVVDDAPTMRLLLRTFLVGMGCIVSEASSGESAVELVRTSLADKSERIEMVICDMRMPPGINGIETARRIKEIPGTEDLPIIGMTADDVDRGAAERAQGVGMVSLVSKPVGRAAIARFLADYTGTVGSSPREKNENESPETFDKERALDNCSGDKALLKTLLGDIGRDLKVRADELRTSVSRKDSARAAEIAHNIKGLAGMCGFDRLMKAAKQLQESASQSDYLEVRNKSQVVMDEIQATVKIAEEYDPLTG